MESLDFYQKEFNKYLRGISFLNEPKDLYNPINYILKNGGNAIDAAIAANAVLGLVEPTGCGIGGDLFAIVWIEKDKKLYGLNSSGPAPKNISIEKIKDLGLDKIPPYGPLPISVPGAVEGWSALHKKFGKFEFAKLFDDAINYAENGVSSI